jgi:SAM-dependent methyltransferase
MTRDELWLSTLWPNLRASLPPPPATVLEIGCGRVGGFIPRLTDCGYRALGIDPVAPDGPSYRQAEFEHSDLPAPVDAIVACTSLHHVAEPAEVLGRAADVLVSDGRMIVIEWDWEGFDEATARWCFDRLGPPHEETWLHRQRDAWQASGETWEIYLDGWTGEHGLHSGRTLLLDLDQRFRRVAGGRGAYYFRDLAATTEAEELEAIALGTIQAGRLDYVGQPL